MDSQFPTYQINRPRMIHETIDQETVIIDTETGVYFNVSGSGPLVWQILEDGANLPAITQSLAAQYRVDAQSLTPAVEIFLAALVEESLVVPSSPSRSDREPGGMLLAASAPFVPPVLTRFTDMEELLLIDPIHEVDDRGWPYRNDATRP